MDPQAFVLFGWVVLLVAAVFGVFWGVLCPAGRTAARTGDLLTRTSSWLACKRVWVLVGVIGSGLVLGMIGADSSLAAGSVSGHGQGLVGRGVDLLYEAVRELTGNASPDPANPLVSRMARAAGLTAILLLAFEVIVKLFQEPVQRLRLWFYRDHIVICGLGRIGRELMTACRRDGMRVVVVERDAQNPALASAIEAGALVWIGDLTRKSVLRVTKAIRARHVFFVSGSDEQNLEAASDLLTVLLEPRRVLAHWRKPPRMTVHLDRPELDVLLIQMKKKLGETAESVKRWVIERHGDSDRCTTDCRKVRDNLAWLEREDIQLHAFNIADRAVHDLFDSHIIDRRPVSTGGKVAHVAHFVILGFGPVGQRLALHLAGQAHFANFCRSRMTIVYGPEDAHRVERFRSEYPALFPTRAIVAEAGEDLASYDPESEQSVWAPDPKLDDWGFGVHVADVPNPTEADRGVSFVCNGGFVRDAAGPLSQGVVDHLVRLARDPAIRPMVFICDTDDENNCSQGVRLREELDLRLKDRGQAQQGRDQSITIFPNVPTRPMLTRLTLPADSLSADLIPFGDAAVSCTYDKLAADPTTSIAKAIHLDYFTQQTTPGVKPVRWEDLPVWERSSNIAAAMHINAKLRLLGLRLVPKGNNGTPNAEIPAPESLSPADRETIAKMEHNRWMAERLLLGWSLGQRAKPENKRRHQFVPWEILIDPNERNKDYTQLAAALRVCQRLVEGEDANFMVLQA